MDNLSQRLLPLAEIIRRCREEARQARSQEQGFCFEMFQRALTGRDADAWAALQEQYQRLVLTWLQRAGNVTPDEADDLACEAWEKFWRTLVRRADDLTAHFHHTGALLKYLQQCAITTLLDRQRRQQRQDRLAARLAEQQAHIPTLSPSDLALRALQDAERLHEAQRWAASQVTDPQERLVLQLSFEEDLSPAEIAARYPHAFGDGHAVRRIKERLLKRARRALAPSG